MKLSLERLYSCDKGIFSILRNSADALLFYTLEHAYPQKVMNIATIPEETEHLPKLPKGIYTCKRGVHQTEHLAPFETFEVADVPGHTGILFHVGNRNEDSDGCVLLGMGCNNEERCLTHSRIAFSKFMSTLEGQDTFTLEVK